MSHTERLASTSAGPLPRLLLAGLLLAGCASPPPPEGPVPPPASAPSVTASWPFRTTTHLGHEAGAFGPLGVSRAFDASRRAGGSADAATSAPAAPPAPPAPSPAAALLPALTDATFDASRGAALDAAIAALPEDRAGLGLPGVDGDLLFLGDEPLCEDPGVALVVDGHEAALTVPRISWFLGAPEPAREALPDACVAALLASAGDLDAVTCDDADEQAHFPPGSDCRACLAEDGDHARCVEVGECAEEAVRQVRADSRWHGVLRVSGLLCAPDHVGEMLVLVEGYTDGDPLPETFDHGAVAGLCVEAWDGAGLDLYCSVGEQNAYADLLYSRVQHIRPVGSDASTWAGRVSLVRSMEVEGHAFTHAWLADTGATAVSAPVGSVPDAWGVNPRALRPDGTDPDDPEHTLARDYVAAFTLKLASERDGVLVNPVNRNRCAEDAWEGPHADGSWSCEAPGAWATEAWYDDAFVAWWNERSGEIYPFPLVTLASTGLPDPDVAGGLLAEVLGSTTLADEEWEACAWPKTFVPDRVRLYDPAPAASDEGYASFDGQTWRFGRSDADVRLFLATSERRGFCPP